jgi:hypothetical protein
MPQPIKISASRGAGILGVSKYKTSLQSWLEIMEQMNPGFCATNKFVVPEFEYNSAMKWGHAFENSIIELVEEKIHGRIINREKSFEKDFITCHIDGQYSRMHDNEIKLHEGKTTGIKTFYSEWGEPGTDRVPMDYQIQTQHQMICTGASEVILSVLVFPRRVDEFESGGWSIQQHEKLDYYCLFNEKEQRATTPENWAEVLNDMGYFHQYFIHPNKTLQELMLDKYSDFWNNNVLKQIPPEPVSCDDIKSIYTEPKGTVIASEQVERWNSERKQLNEEIKEMKKKSEQLKFLEQDFLRTAEKVIDEETREKTYLMSRDGKKIASYGKTGGMR